MRALADETPLHALIGRLYQAALDDDLWPAFLAELAALLHAELPGMVPRIEKDGTAPEVIGLADPSFVRSYAAHYGAILMTTRQRVPPDGTVHLDEVAPVPIERWEFYADWMRPQAQRYLMGQYLMRPDRVPASFGVYREPRAGPFGREDGEIVRTLAPHLARALVLRDRFAVVRSERDVASAVLERLSVGLLLLDERGQLLAANSAAERIARARDGLRLEATRLSLGDRRADHELRRLLAEAAAVARGEGVRGGGAMVVPRPSGRRPYEILVTPLPREGLVVGFRRAAVAVFLSEPEPRPPASEEALRQLYGFTPAEARVALRLSRGDRLEDIADALGVAIGTARNQLKQVFEKTGIHRQAELVRLLAVGISRLARPVEVDPTTRGAVCPTLPLRRGALRRRGAGTRGRSIGR